MLSFTKRNFLSQMRAGPARTDSVPSNPGPCPKPVTRTHSIWTCGGDTLHSANASGTGVQFLPTMIHAITVVITRARIPPPNSLLKNPRQNESSLIQFFYHESVEARMRGAFTDQGQLFSYISPEARVRTDHPLRKIRELVRDVLGELNRSLSRLYACEGRPSIPPEQLLSALLLQVFYGIRSERQLMEQLDYNLLYRWFVGLSPDDLVWDPTVFTKNRDR